MLWNSVFLRLSYNKTDKLPLLNNNYIFRGESHFGFLPLLTGKQKNSRNVKGRRNTRTRYEDIIRNDTEQVLRILKDMNADR